MGCLLISESGHARIACRDGREGTADDPALVPGTREDKRGQYEF